MISYKKTLLAGAICFALTNIYGCGGGGSSSDSNTTTPSTEYLTVNIKAVDGVLENASACIDLNNDYLCDTESTKTDTLGLAAIKIEKTTLEAASNPKAIISATTNAVINYSDNTSRQLPTSLWMTAPLTVADNSTTVANIYTTAASKMVINGEAASYEVALSSLATDTNSTTDKLQADYTSDKTLAIAAESLMHNKHLPVSSNDFKNPNNTNFGEQVKNSFDFAYNTVLNDDGKTSIKDLIDKNVQDMNQTDPDKVEINASFSATADNLVVSFSSNVLSTDNKTPTYFWDFGDNSTSTEKNPVHTYAKEGTYNVVLKATSNDGTVSTSYSSQITVSQNITNTAPVAKFEYSANYLEVTFDASKSTDVDGDILGYTWLIDGKKVSSSTKFSYTFPKDGSYTVVLEANDGLLSNTTTKTITVSSNNVIIEKPTVTFSCVTNTLNLSCENTTSAQEGSVSSYYWLVNDTKYAEGESLNYTANTSTNVTVKLVAKLADNTEVTSAVGTYTLADNETPVNHKPVIESIVSAIDDKTVSFVSSATDPDGDAITYTWDFGDGSEIATGQNVTHTFAEYNKSYTVTLVVTDSKNASATSSKVITLKEVIGPVLTADFQCTNAGLAVTCTPTEDAAEGSSFSWTLNNAEIGSSSSLNYSFAAAGTYNLTLKVVIGETTKTVTHQVTVAPIAGCTGEFCDYTELLNKFEDLPQPVIDSDYNIYLKVSSSTTPILYAYKSTTELLGKWPGTNMQPTSVQDVWSAQLPAGTTAASLIFNNVDGSNRYPAASLPGIDSTGSLCFDFDSTKVKTPEDCGITVTQNPTETSLYFSNGNATNVTEIREELTESGKYIDTALFILGDDATTATTGTYSVNGKQIGTFTNGQVLRIGEKVTPADTNTPVEINVSINYGDKVATAKFKKIKYEQAENPLLENACLESIQDGNNLQTIGSSQSVGSRTGSFNNKLLCYKNGGEESCNLRIFQVMVESFQDGDSSVGYGVGYGTSNHNGDLRGVINAVPYLKELGVNAVWLTPIFNSCNGSGSGCSQLDATGYFTKDYFSIDGHFGTEKDFEELVDLLHKNNMYIILDGVFGHFRGDINTQSNDGSILVTTTKCYGSGMNTYSGTCADWTNSSTENFYKDVATYWIKKFKIDGWRLDQAYQVNPVEKWANVRKAVEATSAETTYVNGNGETVNPLGYMVGELWEGNANIQKYGFGPSSNPGLKSNFDFNMRYALVQALAVEESGKKDHSGTRLMTQFNDNESAFEAHAQPNLMITNHDLVRFGDLLQRGSIAEPSDSKYWNLHKCALAFQAAYSGPITVYYGDEIGQEVANFSAKKNQDGYYDDHVSRDNGRISGFSANEQDLHDYEAKLLAIRAAHPALYNGSMTPIVADSNMFIALKNAGDDKVIFALNLGDEDKTINLSTTAAGATTSLTDAVTGYKYTPKNGNFVIPMGKYTSGLFIVDRSDSDLLCH